MADALEAWIDRSGLRKKIELASVVDAWPEAVGPQIAAVTRALANDFGPPTPAYTSVAMKG